MYVANNPLSKNLANFLGYKGHYSRDGEFSSNLDLIEAKLGINKITVRKWIMGKENPMLDSLSRVCALFGWNIYELFVDQDKHLGIEGLDKEHVHLMKMLVKVKNKALLDGIMSIIKGALTVEKENITK